MGAGMASNAAPLRQTESLNREWQFVLGDQPGAQAV